MDEAESVTRLRDAPASDHGDATPVGATPVGATPVGAAPEDEADGPATYRPGSLALDKGAESVLDQPVARDSTNGRNGPIRFPAGSGLTDATREERPEHLDFVGQIVPPTIDPASAAARRRQRRNVEYKLRRWAKATTTWILAVGFAVGTPVGLIAAGFGPPPHVILGSLGITDTTLYNLGISVDLIRQLELVPPPEPVQTAEPAGPERPRPASIPRPEPRMSGWQGAGTVTEPPAWLFDPDSPAEEPQAEPDSVDPEPVDPEVLRRREEAAAAAKEAADAAWEECQSAVATYLRVSGRAPGSTGMSRDARATGGASCLSALRFLPTSPPRQTHYGYMLASLGRYREAAQYFTSAARLGSRSAIAALSGKQHCEAATAAFYKLFRARRAAFPMPEQQATWAAGRIACLRALQVDRSSSETHLSYGLMLALSGEVEAGWTWISAAADMNNTGAVEVITRLGDRD